MAAYLRSGFLPPQWLPTSAVAAYLRSGRLPPEWLPTSAVAAYLRSGRRGRAGIYRIRRRAASCRGRPRPCKSGVIILYKC